MFVVEGIQDFHYRDVDIASKRIVDLLLAPVADLVGMVHVEFATVEPVFGRCEIGRDTLILHRSHTALHGSRVGDISSSAIPPFSRF